MGDSAVSSWIGLATEVRTRSGVEILTGTLVVGWAQATEENPTLVAEQVKRAHPASIRRSFAPHTCHSRQLPVNADIKFHVIYSHTVVCQLSADSRRI